jgi:hypothetical protein
VTWLRNLFECQLAASGFRLAVSHGTQHHLPPVVERRAMHVCECVAELTALLAGAWCFRGGLLGVPPGTKLTRQLRAILVQPIEAAPRRRCLQVRIGNQPRTAVAVTGDVENTEGRAAGCMCGYGKANLEWCLMPSSRGFNVFRMQDSRSNGLSNK